MTRVLVDPTLARLDCQLWCGVGYCFGMVTGVGCYFLTQWLLQGGAA